LTSEVPAMGLGNESYDIDINGDDLS